VAIAVPRLHRLRRRRIAKAHPPVPRPSQADVDDRNQRDERDQHREHVDRQRHSLRCSGRRCVEQVARLARHVRERAAKRLGRATTAERASSTTPSASIESHATYTPITPMAIVAKPPAITAISSERVMRARYGRIKSGASVWPTKTFAAHERLSAPDTPRMRVMTNATPATSRCNSPT
jgi:hypothetical protein